MEPISIKIEYWTYPDGTMTGVEPTGIEDFRSKLQNNYVSFVKGTSGECGGLYDLVIHITSSISLRDVVSAILGGVAYDLVKLGTRSLVLRPFVEAIKELKEKNKKEHLEIETITFSFQDAEIIIKNLQDVPAIDSLGDIFAKLASSYDSLIGRNSETPYAIHIPILNDKDCSFCKFRSPLEYDETLVPFKANDYLKYWGIIYNLETQCSVYDAESKLMLNMPFLTEEEYWREEESNSKD